jgi:hypothetical protein
VTGANGAAMTARYWFKPKRYGLGATPVTWEGWAITGLAVAILACATWYLMGRGGPAGPVAFAVWLVVMVAVTAGLLIVTKAKTQGEWRWRWGGRE